MTFRTPVQLLLSVLVLTSCAGRRGGGDGDGGPDNPPDLFVDVRTDVRPGYEFAVVRADLIGAEATGSSRVERPVVVADTTTYLEGARVAQFEDVSRSQVAVRVALLDRMGLPLLEHAAAVQLGWTDRVVTVVLTRDCAGVMCPGVSDDASLVACLGGRCVDPRCSPETPEHCPTGCSSDGDCSVEASCATGQCESGTCLRVEREGVCSEDEWCHPETGCAKLGAGDAGALPDGGTDAASP